MSKSYHKNVQRQLVEIINLPGNDNRCAECKSEYPTWASWNLGVLLCGRCANMHRSELRGLSKVKSLALDDWSPDQINRLKRGSSHKNRRKWYGKRVAFPYDEDDDAAIREFFRLKYADLSSQGDSYDDDDHNGKYLSSYDDRDSRSRRSRSNSARSDARSRGPVPRLTHRKLTTFESTQFSSQLSQMMSFGYSDRDAAREALILSNGDVDFALDILEQDTKLNPSSAETAPALPKRPPPQTFAANNPMASSTQSAPAGNDWWAANGSRSASTSAGMSAATTGAITPTQPQIYQYTDPVTGQVSYIDSNGQQYLDPSNPQHQQMLYQQTNPQLVAQQTNKQNIMSLYSQPNQFATVVAAPTGQQIQQQPPQQQQQQQYQQIMPQYQQPQAQYYQNQFVSQPTGAGFQQPYNQ